MLCFIGVLYKKGAIHISIEKNKQPVLAECSHIYKQGSVTEIGNNSMRCADGGDRGSAARQGTGQVEKAIENTRFYIRSRIYMNDAAEVKTKDENRACSDPSVMTSLFL